MEAGKGKWEGPEALGVTGGRRDRSCTSVDAEKGQGEQRGSVFTFLTGGAVVLASFLCWVGGGGVAAGLGLRRSIIESSVSV